MQSTEASAGEVGSEGKEGRNLCAGAQNSTLGVTHLSSDPSYEGALGVLMSQRAVMVEGEPAAAVGVKRHCRFPRQRHSSPGWAAVFITRTCSAPSARSTIQRAPYCVCGHASLRVLQEKESRRWRLAEPGLQGFRGGGLSSTADVLGV